MTGPHGAWLLAARGLRVSCRTRLLTSGFHGYLRTTLVGSEAGAVAPEVGLGDVEEASSLEDGWGDGDVGGGALGLLLPHSVTLG